MQLRNILLVMLAVYGVLLLIDFTLTCSLMSHPEMEMNIVARYFLEHGILPINLAIPYIIITILFIYGYDRFYYDIKLYKMSVSEFLSYPREEIPKLKIYYFNTTKMFVPMYFMMLIFIVGHVRGILSYL